MNIEYRDIYNLINAHDKVKDCYKPIPLTEEWLVKFGGQVYEFDHKENQYRIEDDLFVIRGGKIYHYGTNVCLDCVHTLQNLIFALRKKELILKQ